MSIGNDLNSSTRSAPLKAYLSALGNSSIELSALRESRLDTKEEDLVHTQPQLIPPIRSFTTRGGLHFPSIDSLRSHLSRLHTAAETPLKRQPSTEIRASIDKLESLVQEATRLAESIAIHSQDDNKTKDSQGEIKSLKEPAVQRTETTPTVANTSTRRSVKFTRPTFKNLRSLPLVSRTLARPVLTLPVSKSAEDILWSQDSVSEEPQALPATPREPFSDIADPERVSVATTVDNEPNVTSPEPLDHNQSTRLHPEIGPRSSSLKKENSHTARLKPPLVLVNGVAFQDSDDTYADERLRIPLPRVRTGHERHYSNFFGLPSRQVSIDLNHHVESGQHPKIDLRRKSHVDVYNPTKAFDLHQTCSHATIARNWPNSRKRFTALIACLNTSCIGLLLGIYAGEVPAIQYAIADFGHYSILGNVLMYLGMALSGMIFWPLPLLHGRKPYVVAAQLLALVLQVPQGLAVDGWRDPSQPAYKCLLLISRAVSGFALGLADMNIKATLLDCFGASLQSQSSDFDKYEIYDVRRHGGGMGMWLGFASWSSIGPISVGFMIGASIINSGISVAWGFWISFCIVLVVLLINIIMPEVRRSAFRRTISELTGDAGEFARVTRGEIKMHLTMTGPY